MVFGEESGGAGGREEGLVIGGGEREDVRGNGGKDNKLIMNAL